jgi:hypothetical protein
MKGSKMGGHLADWKPAVPREWLLFCAGLMWCVVGLMLMRLSWIWSSAAGWRASVPFLGLGLLVSTGTHYFFRRFAAANIGRIGSLPPKACIFAFQSWSSYPLVAFMMTLGIGLKSSFLPKIWLAGVYLAIGAGLFLAGLNYFSTLVKARFKVG